MDYSLSDDHTLQNITSSSSNLFSSSGIGDTTHDTTFLGVDSSLNSNVLDGNSDEDEDVGALLGIRDEKDEGLLEKLIRAWVDERNAPEVLKWEEDVVEGLLVRLNAQAEMVSTLQSDSRTTEEEYFRIILIQTEAERVKFLVRSYLRARLWKIEKYATHILASPELRSRLSVAEVTHAGRYKDLLARHYHNSALSGLPESLQSLEEEGENGMNMVSRPNLKHGVFVRARRRCNTVLPDGVTLDLRKGVIHLVQYGSIQGVLRAGDVELV